MTDQTLQRSPTMPRKSVPIDKIRTVTGNTFSALVLAGEGPMAVEFMSYGCAHCRARIGPKERIFRVNIAVEQELAESYEIQGTPTLIMFLNGREVGRVEGPSPTVSSVLKVVTQPFES